MQIFNEFIGIRNYKSTIEWEKGAVGRKEVFPVSAKKRKTNQHKSSVRHNSKPFIEFNPYIKITQGWKF